MLHHYSKQLAVKFKIFFIIGSFYYSMKLELKPEDIEVEILAPGPIIHIFPKQDPYNAIEEILKGLYMMDSLQELYKEW